MKYWITWVGILRTMSPNNNRRYCNGGYLSGSWTISAVIEKNEFKCPRFADFKMFIYPPTHFVLEDIASGAK